MGKNYCTLCTNITKTWNNFNVIKNKNKNV